jgi:hypothetical protein
MKIVKCIVAGHNANGEPDLYFCKVRCTEQQIDNGEHYERAQRVAQDDGYDEKNVAFDEFDPAGAAMLGLFEWDTASELVINP